MNRILCIVNSISGTRNRRLDATRMKQTLLDAGIEATVVPTRYAGHAGELASEAVKKDTYDVVLAAGGDGTINEIANALVHSDIILGILPMGSGNGLAHHLNIPRKLKEALEVVKEQHFISIDAGTCWNSGIGKHYFFSNCGVGYDAEVIHNYDAVERRGFFTYMYFMFKSIVTLKPSLLHLKCNDRDEKMRPFVLTAANSSQYGYNIKVAPQADITDGILDLMIVEDATYLRVFRFAFLALLSKQDQVEDVATYMRTTEVELTFDQVTKFQSDGEAYMIEGKLNIGIDPGCLKVFVPKIANG